ncbi:hypothetical protein Psuf_046340 [Phytohabitans suffuscus]|uniref:Uncharacterized protein n=1 Tax=Phytohabitans suffuscus TaxID=624315 RepID=A0A6F8YN08_9ACTN|nr:hypothetical protein Psuf_046340 [Phytohabitans suffuscus]
MVAVGGEPGGDLALGRDGGRAGARGGGGERGRRDGPQRLYGGEPREQVGRAEQVADPEPGQAPGLGEAAHDHQPRQVAPLGEGRRLAGRVGERLVHHQYAAGPGEGGDRLHGVKHRRRVGGVADEDEVGVAGHQCRVERVPGRRRQQHAGHLVAGVAQRRLRLGELGMHDHRTPRPAQCLREQYEALCRPGGEQDLGGRACVPGGDRGGGRRRIGVRGEVGQRRRDRLGQPWRHRRAAHVDREIDEARPDLQVAVKTEIHALQDDRGFRHASARHVLPL